MDSSKRGAAVPWSMRIWRRGDVEDGFEYEAGFENGQRSLAAAAGVDVLPAQMPGEAGHTAVGGNEGGLVEGVGRVGHPVFGLLPRGIHGVRELLDPRFGPPSPSWKAR